VGANSEDPAVYATTHAAISGMCWSTHRPNLPATWNSGYIIAVSRPLRSDGEYVYVTTNSPPQVLRIPIIGTFAALLAADFWISYRNPVFLLMSVVTWPLICVGLLRTLTTRLTHEGASQMTLRGRRHLAWTEVVEVSRNGRAYWLKGNGQKLFLWLALFEDSDAAYAFVEEHLPTSARNLSV